MVKDKLNLKHREENEGETIDLTPVVKFFGGSSATWLFTEYDPEEEIFFGLCDPGLGFPEVGYVSKEELFNVKFPPFGLGLERDRHFKAKKTLSKYSEEARELRYIKS